MFEELRALISFLQRRPLSIDGLVFGLSCRLTAILLMAGLTVVCSTQFIGKQIHCDSVGIKVDQQFIDNYCLLYSTYIVHRAPDSPDYNDYHDTRNRGDDRDGIFAGIGPEIGARFDIDYYQWIWIIYFFQALCFYFPHWLWKILEGRRVRTLVSNADSLIDRDHCQKHEYDKLARMATYVAESFGTNRRYMVHYYLCEWLAFGNLLLQLYTLDRIFAGHYWTYGFDALAMSSKLFQAQAWRRLNPMNTIFPRMTKCQYHRYGPSGASENIDALCMLPLNVFNDKFFLFLWFWIYFMMVLYGITFLYRAAQSMVPSLRVRYLCSLMQSKHQRTVLQLRSLSVRLEMADWFFLTLIATNVDRLFFGRLLEEIIARVPNVNPEEEQPLEEEPESGKHV